VNSPFGDPSGVSRLGGKVAVVTGGTNGIGFAIAARLLAEGASVLIAGLDETAVEVAMGKLGGAGVHGHAGDLSQPGVADELVAGALSRFDRLDILVNNAGGGVISPTLEHTEDTLQRTIDNNLWTTVRCTLAALPQMVAQGGGRIISIGAESVRNGLTDHAVYNAAKGGVHGFATGLAREFAPHGITVNVVAPSYVRTPELDAALAAGRAPARVHQVVEDAVRLIPLGRPGSVADVAAAVSYLASDDAAFVTGQVLSVNGGSSML
jgi:2,3-dihydroxy-2,3-dihydro-p-cumate dehydrogenase